MGKSIRTGDWVRSIKKSSFKGNEIQCPFGEIRQVKKVSGNSIIFDGFEHKGCAMERFERVKSMNFLGLYEKLKD